MRRSKKIVENPEKMPVDEWEKHFFESEMKFLMLEN